MGRKTVTLTIQAADADGFAQSQSVDAGAAAVLNGVLASGLTCNAIISIATSSDETGETCTLVGSNLNGDAMTEVVALGNATTVTSTYRFSDITSATFSAAATGVTIGHDPANGASSAYIGTTYDKIGWKCTAQCVITAGTPTYAVYACIDSPTEQTAWWYRHEVLFNKTEDAISGYDRPVAGIGLLSQSASGAVELTVLEPS